MNTLWKDTMSLLYRLLTLSMIAGTAQSGIFAMESAQISKEEVASAQAAQKLIQTIEQRFDEGALDTSLAAEAARLLTQAPSRATGLAAYNVFVESLNAGFGKKMLDYFKAFSQTDSFELSELMQLSSLHEFITCMQSEGSVFRWPENVRKVPFKDEQDLKEACEKVLEAKTFFDGKLPRIAQALFHDLTFVHSAALRRIEKDISTNQQAKDDFLADVRLVFLKAWQHERIRRYDEAVASIYRKACDRVIGAVLDARRSLEQGHDPHHYFEYKLDEVLRNNTHIYADTLDVKDSTDIPQAVPLTEMRDLLEKIAGDTEKLGVSFDAYWSEKLDEALPQKTLSSRQKERSTTVTVFDLIRRVVSSDFFQLVQRVNALAVGLCPDPIQRVSAEEWAQISKDGEAILQSSTASVADREQAAYNYYRYKEDRPYLYTPMYGHGPEVEGFIEFAERSQELRIRAFYPYSLCSFDEKKRMALELYQLEGSRVSKVLE